MKFITIIKHIYKMDGTCNHAPNIIMSFAYEMYSICMAMHVCMCQYLPPHTYTLIFSDLSIATKTKENIQKHSRLL